ncbi:zinc metallopeptidase [Thermomicrobium roseum]|jgi:Zn-dependent membrane protease YugP|uniref:Putative Zn-dependent protease n=1 Tax=Thermomicrobium roseum (strain ATCC 27502 / DSM 5159 / P-2) TaxID=309801 RepID=B9L1E0_THERP|nr:zinc metallopeptidase [Thermomicrobium roseum]ACM05660.1 putative Zn-dependent protease [Thermomicrobium roseum DSM 5159]MBO9384832.1 zinc metallopeptidase [Thermomicrobium sp.]
MFYFDPLYFVFLAPALLLMLYAQWRVRSVIGKYGEIPNRLGLTGAQVARAILDRNGLFDVPVELTPGELTDHYDPLRRVVRLSEPVYYGRSVAALGVAAHETGHAIQHKVGYVPLQLRTAIVPAVNIGTNIGWILMLLGIVIGISGLAWVGVILFSLGTLFALLTLPVEFDASRRALALLTTMGIVDRTEEGQAREVLNAAALTYVAGLVMAVLNLLYWISLVSGMRRSE